MVLSILIGMAGTAAVVLTIFAPIFTPVLATVFSAVFAPILAAILTTRGLVGLTRHRGGGKQRAGDK